MSQWTADPSHFPEGLGERDRRRFNDERTAARATSVRGVEMPK